MHFDLLETIVQGIGVVVHFFRRNVDKKFCGAIATVQIVMRRDNVLDRGAVFGFL